jgi:hypothetical protein
LNTTKYGKYILRQPTAKWGSVEPEPEGERRSIRINSNLMSTIGVDVAFMGVTPELVQQMASRPGHPSHVHDVDEYLFFMGGDPTNILDFGAEVELTLGTGEDQEKHIIDTPSIVYIPKGLAHLPMVYKKVDKPVYFGHLLMAPDYVETRLE